MKSLTHPNEQHYPQQLGFNVLEAITDAFVFVDREWRFTYVNQIARDMAGRELLGEVLWEVYPTLLGSSLEIAYREATDQRVPVQLEFQHPETNKWIELRAFPTDQGLAVFFRDVSVRKQREMEVIGQEKRFRELADEMPQIAWSADAEGNILFINSKWFEHTGIDPAVPAAEQYKLGVHPDDLELSHKVWNEGLGANSTLEFETRIRDREGNYRWHLARMVPIRDESGIIRRWHGTSTDIHERKIAEQRLAESERRFQIALGGAQVIAYEQDADLRYVWLYPQTELFEPAIGRRDDEILPDDEGPELMRIKREVLRTGQRCRQTIKATIGGLHFYDLMVEPILDDDGNAIGVTGAALDVTSQFLAEEALHQSEERFRKAIQNSPIAKIIHADDGEIIQPSKAWIQATGFEERETPTVADWIRLAGAKAPGLESALSSCFVEGPHQSDAVEHKIQTRSGRELIWIITSAPLGLLPDGRRLAISSAIDVTSSRWTAEGRRFLTEAGRTLAENLDYEKTLSAIANLAVPGLADWCAVDMFEERVGLDGEQHPARSIKRVAVAHVDPDKVKWAHQIQEQYPVKLDAPNGVGYVLRTGQSELIGEVTQEMIDAADLDKELIDIVRKADIKSIVTVPLIAREEAMGAISFISGIPGRFEERDLVIFEELGRIAGLAVENARLYRSAQDEVRERQIAEDEVRRLNDLLNVRVIERTRELEAANREMEGFTYSVSHDLRAPLRAIISTSRMLLADCGDRLPESGKVLLERQAAAAKKLGDLIDELLKLSRLSRQEMEWDRVDLTLLAADTIALLKAEGLGFGHSFDIQPNLLAAGDARLLRFVLLNLLDNAIKFSPAGGTISVGREGDEFFVRDAGIGFEMEYANKLFLPFERLVSDQCYPGTGIGLANVQRIVQRHGGNVRAESSLGEGSTFFFTLPDVIKADARRAGNELPAGNAIAF